MLIQQLNHGKGFQKELTHIVGRLVVFRARMNYMPKSKSPKTHFDQVPLEIVKKVTAEETPGARENRAGATDKSPRKRRFHSRVRVTEIERR